MAITTIHVREILKGLETGDGASFFEYVADDVDWTVMGTHPLAGDYLGKKVFRERTFGKLGKVLPEGAQLKVEHLFVWSRVESSGLAFRWRRREMSAISRKSLTPLRNCYKVAAVGRESEDAALAKKLGASVYR